MLLIVVVAHGLLALLLAQALRPTRPAPPPAPAARPAWLHLLRDPAPVPAPAPAQVSTRHVRVQATPAALQQHAPPPAQGQAISLGAVTMDAARAEPPLPAASVPLDLRLPRRASSPLPAAALTRGDARVREPLSYGERMARGIGTDTTLQEDTMPDGSRRLRRGTGCVMARPSRDSELDAFNNSAVPKPRLVGSC